MGGFMVTPARITPIQSNPQVSDRHQAWSGAMMLVRRKTLAASVRELKEQARCREAAAKLAELRHLTLELLAVGGRN